jgi:hypothetical protein
VREKRGWEVWESSVGVPSKKKRAPRVSHPLKGPRSPWTAT